LEEIGILHADRAGVHDTSLGLLGRGGGSFGGGGGRSFGGGSGFRSGGFGSLLAADKAETESESEGGERDTDDVHRIVPNVVV